MAAPDAAAGRLGPSGHVPGTVLVGNIAGCGFTFSSTP